MRLRSVVGERRKWSAVGETAGTQTERNAVAEPQTEASRICGQSIAARDERVVLRSGTGVVERATGRRVACGAQQSTRWSRRIKNLRCLTAKNYCSQYAAGFDKNSSNAIPPPPTSSLRFGLNCLAKASMPGSDSGRRPLFTSMAVVVLPWRKMKSTS